MRIDPVPGKPRIYGFNAFSAPYCKDIQQFFDRYGFALDLDLLDNCFSTARDPRVLQAAWPADDPRTTLHWLPVPQVTDCLEGLADEAVRALRTRNDETRIGQTIIEVCDHIPFLGHAIAAVTYARETGRVKELRLGNGTPLYFVTDDLADTYLAA